MLETIWESRRLPQLYGGVAQLGEHLPCKQGVMSSNLTISTQATRNVKRSEWQAHACVEAKAFAEAYEATAVMK